MEIVFNNFSGGLNNRFRPSKIGKTQAQVFDNIDITSGTIKPGNKDSRLGAINVPYQLAHFNQLIGTEQHIETSDTLVSQWGKYYTKDTIYYVDSSDNTIKSSTYGIGVPGTAEFTTTVNEVNFENAKDLKGIIYGLTEDASGNLISDQLIDGISKEAISIYEAWESEALVVYEVQEDGTELTGKIKEVINAKMPYMVGSNKYCYVGSDNNDNYSPAGADYKFTLHYEPLHYSVTYTKEGIKQKISWIDAGGNPIDINKAILTNAIVVINADESGITTGYARGNIVENLPFMAGTKKYTMSSTAPDGYESADTTRWKCTVIYDATDYDATDFHTWAITFYNPKTGQETAPIYGTTTKVHPAELGTSFTFTSTPQPEGIYDDFAKARIYRVSGPYTSYRFAKEVDVIKSGDSYVVTLNELIKNDKLQYVCPTTGFVPKPTMQDIAWHANRIWGFNGNTLYYTLTDNPYSWSELATIYTEGAILAIQTTSAGLLILTNSYKAYLVTGVNPNTFTMRKIAENVGYSEGMIGMNGHAYWIYNNDLYTSNGQQIVNLTQDKFKLPDEAIIDINVLNNDIYLVYTNYIYKFHKGSITKLDRANVIGTVVKNGVLHYFKDDYEWSLNTSKTTDKFEYTSPDIYVTTLADIKEYDEVVITTSGRLTAKVFIDGIMVKEDSISSDGLITTRIKIPVTDNKGHRLTLNLKGSGEVYEYIIFAVGAKNGR